LLTRALTRETEGAVAGRADAIEPGFSMHDWLTRGFHLLRTAPNHAMRRHTLLRELRVRTAGLVWRAQCDG
jgi:hypothetical protein